MFRFRWYLIIPVAFAAQLIVWLLILLLLARNIIIDSKALWVVFSPGIVIFDNFGVPASDSMFVDLRMMLPDLILGMIFNTVYYSVLILGGQWLIALTRPSADFVAKRNRVRRKE